MASRSCVVGADNTLDFEPEQITEGAGGLELTVGDTVIPALPLDELVGTPSDRPLTTAVVFRAGTARLALLVECLQELSEAHSRPSAELSLALAWARLGVEPARVRLQPKVSSGDADLGAGLC